jgi:hypothetical protein
MTIKRCALWRDRGFGRPSRRGHRRPAVDQRGASSSVLSAEDMLGKAAELRGLVDRLKTVAECLVATMPCSTAWSSLPSRPAISARTRWCRTSCLPPRRLSGRTISAASTSSSIDKTTTVICDPTVPGFRRSRPWQVSYIALDDRQAHLRSSWPRPSRLELPRASWVEPSGLFQHRAEMTVVALDQPRATRSADSKRPTRSGCRPGCTAMPTRVARDGTYPLPAMRRSATVADTTRRDQDGTRYRRSGASCWCAPTDHPDAVAGQPPDLQMVVPYDFVSRFVFDKQGFYKAYEAI